jgi:hypothetical protein
MSISVRHYALALAAEVGWCDQLRREMFAAQPSPGSAGYGVDGLIALGRHAGSDNPEYATAIRQGRYQPWARKRDKVFSDHD